jgi:S1-C subfamily serine protease
MKKILLVMFILLFTAATVFSGEFEDTLKKAEQGDAWSQCQVASIYYSEGQYKQSAYWYTKAAEQDIVEAQVELGYMYAFGESVAQNDSKANLWWLRAASKGDNYVSCRFGLSCNLREVYYNLGISFRKGKGASQDYKQANHWIEKSAKLGYSSAQACLGTMYYLGEGVPQNFKLAYVWESLAAAQGNENAIKNRDITAKKLTPQQLSEAQDLAAKIQYRIDNPEKQKPSSVSTPAPNKQTPKSTSDTDVRWVQQTLKNLGYDPGPVDGLMGARTRDAIIAFQTDISVTPTGTIDEILFAQLRQMTKINQESPPAKTDTGKIIGSGTGFFITRDGYILTCLHVVEDAAKIEIYVGDKMYPASLIRSDSNNDLAILKVTGSFPALAFAPHRSAKMGQDVFTVGYPNPGLQGVSAKYTKGTISSLTGFKDDLRLYQISIPIQPGNSGGALLDEHGNALGVVMAMLNAKTTFQVSGSLPQNVNYAVKSLYAQAMIDTMPEVAGKLLSPSRSKANAIDNAQERTVMVICYD